MSSENNITLYDVPSDLDGKAWSPHMWKVRYVLNFKEIPYKTTWLEYPEIEPAMRSIGAAPTGTKPDGSPFYTLPVIVDHSRRTPSGGPIIVSESFVIAEYLDHIYPSPRSLFPEGTKALQKLFYDYFFPTVQLPGITAMVPLIYFHLNEGSQPYWRKTREMVIGGKLEEVCPRGSKKWDEVWDNVQEGFSNVAALMDKNEGDTTFILGENMSFVDLTVAALLETIFLINPEEWSKISTWDDGRWVRLRDLCSEWRSVH